MNIVIIEDESPAAKTLKKMVKKINPSAEVIAIIDSVEEGLAYFSAHSEPDLILSDIELTDGTSFDIFEVYPLQCPVIFTTAYDQYAIRAFKVNSIDYLLKPIQPRELSKTLQKFEQLYAAPQIDYNQLKKALNKTEYRHRFTGKIGQTLQIISVEETAYFLSEEGITFLYNQSGKRFIVDYSLEQLTNLVDPKLFFRVNRQLLVHIQSIQQIKPYFKGRLLLKLEPKLEDQHTVSQSNAGDFKEWLKG